MTKDESSESCQLAPGCLNSWNPALTEESAIINMAARGAGLPTAVHTHFRAHAEFKVRYAREDSSIVRMRKGIKTSPICKIY